MFEPPVLHPDEQASYRLRELYQRHGYSHYRMSKFEEYDLYVRNKSFLVSEQVLTFTDTDGRLMALKPDVTLSIVKNTPDSGGALQKVYYHENVYRTSPTAMGYREIMQTGLECIGELDLYAMGEVLSLAAQSLALISGDYLLDMSHMGIVSGLLEGLEESVGAAILAEMGRKNAPALREVCARAGVAHALADRLCRLALLYGSAEAVLPQLEELAQGQTMTAALGELRSLCAMLEKLGLQRNLRLDFSIAGGMSYYNGIIFRGYLPGLASGVLAGGRYDNLLKRMGKHGGAIGFAVYLDQLERFGRTAPSYDVDTLLLYSSGDDPAQLALRAEELSAQGRTVRVERSVPQGLRCREIIRFGEGA